MSKQVSDRDLFFLISKGDEDAKNELDSRYCKYLRGLVKRFIDSHIDLGYSFDDYFNAAIIGYLKARNRFQYELSEAFFPYCSVWALSEMRTLFREGSDFFLREQPKKFLSFDSTYNDDDDMVLCERYGEEDSEINDNVNFNEILLKISDKSTGLNQNDIIVTSLLALNWSKKEIIEFTGLTYHMIEGVISKVSLKLKDYLESIKK